MRKSLVINLTVEGAVHRIESILSKAQPRVINYPHVINSCRAKPFCPNESESRKP